LYSRISRRRVKSQNIRRTTTWDGNTALERFSRSRNCTI
jgi:hypothetical protein